MTTTVPPGTRPPADAQPKAGKRRRPLGVAAYNVLKAVHIALAAVWVGTAFAGLFVLTAVMDRHTVVGTVAVVRWLDLLIWIPVNVLTLVTAIVFSVRTRWRFFKHGWVTAKYLINLVPLTLGGPLLAPPMVTMAELTDKRGEAAYDLAEFTAARTRFTVLLTVLLMLLLAAVYLSVFKPKALDRRRRRTVPRLAVSNVVRETPDAVSVSFTVPERLRETFRFTAGQYVTLEFLLGGRRERRAYSLSSAPGAPELTISVKRMPGGLVSSYVNDTLRVGDKVHVAPPRGRFIRGVDLAGDTPLHLLAAGSGIAPMRSVIRAALRGGRTGWIHLLYGNRTPQDAIFMAELDALAAADPRFTVDHTFSRLPEGDDAPGGRGRITADTVHRWLAAHPAAPEGRAFLLCGPNEFVDDMRQALADLGVAPERIGFEYFTTAAPVARSGGGTGAVALTALLEGEGLETTTDRATTVTDALEAAGFDPPYTCRSGTCSSCVARVLEGSVVMRECHALDQNEIELGLVLTCQALPTTNRLTVSFDDAQ
jgi:ring-1,2-phenylacetyl-CoA epoxidase subunit PaaE